MFKLRTARLLVLLVVLALVAAACGDDGRDSSSSGSGSETDSGSEEPAPDSESETDSATFGDLEFPCGPQDGGGELPAGDPEETFGISDAGINIGTFADPGYEGAPGISQEVFDASEAFAAACNDAGGINGRPVISHLRDSALFNYPARVEEACAQDFAVVGGEAALDDSGAQLLTDCGLVSFPATAINAPAALADNVVLALPNGPYQSSSAYMEKLVTEIDDDGAGTDVDAEDLKQNAGILYGDIAILSNAAERIKQVGASVGFEFVYDATYNILGEANWAPFAQSIADAGVEVLFYVGSPEVFLPLEESMDQLGSAPAIIVHENNFYSPLYSEGTDGLIPDTIKLARSAIWPTELADQSPATQRYLDILFEYVPDGRDALLGIESMSAWLLFAQVAAECDRNNDLTRSCVYDAGRAVDAWTGGGLHATTNPATAEPTTCEMLLQATGGSFEIWRGEGDTPEDAFYCDPEAVVEIEGDFGEGVVRGGG